MRFLLDAQLSRQLAGHLIRSGHEASHVFEHLDPQANDLAVVAVANQLDASVMSKDSDFRDRALRGELLRTLIWIRVPNLSNDLLWQRVERALPAIVSAARDDQRIVEVF